MKKKVKMQRFFAARRAENMELWPANSVEGCMDDNGEITAEEYARAFGVLGDKMPTGWALIEAHLEAQITTWEDLAKPAGLKSYRAVNAHYGKFAHAVGELLGFVEAPYGYWVFVLVAWAEEQPGSRGHTAFVLREPVIEALRQLGFPAPESNGGCFSDARAGASRAASVKKEQQKLHLPSTGGRTRSRRANDALRLEKIAHCL